MGYFSHKIVLDMHSTISQASLSVKLGDTNWKICAILTENGKTYNIPEGSTAIFTGKKADNTDLFNDCTIEGNTIIYDFTKQTCSSVGRVDCEIRLTDAEGKIITSPAFTIVVENTVVDENHIIESNDEVQVLTNLINEVETKLENGEFVGEKGENGLTPYINAAGNWQIGDTDTGVNGTNGDSAYDIAKKNGFEGTEAEWLASLKGEPGEKGDKGDTGERGENGYTPIKGTDYYTPEEKAELVQEIEQTAIGDVDAALDHIIAIQNELIGGGSL